MNKYLIVGGVAGGMSAAARLRRLDENAEIIVFERGNYVSYANCGLPYYIGDVINDRDMLVVQTPEHFRDRFNVDVRLQNEVIAIDRKKKSVTVKNNETENEYTESYTSLLLSPGADPLRPPIPGIDSKSIFTLRSIPDTDQIKTFMQEHKPKRALVVGAGFIGLEMAENLHEQGVKVTIVELAKQVMNVVDYDMAASVHQHLKTKNVEFYLGDGVAAFKEDESGKVNVTLNSGKKLIVDIVILSIGIRPETTLAQQANLEVGERRGIKVNEYLQTNDKNIYAVGDAIEVFNPIIKKNVLIPLGGPANKQGRMAADNMVLGNKKKFSGTIGTAIAKVFDLTVGATGASEKLLKAEGIPYETTTIHVSHHAGYYPGALPMTVKMQFSPSDGKVLGAEIVGYEGVDKRIDVFAMAIKYGQTIYDLAEFEHAYAPPYSSAKDPVNIAAFVAENILSGKVKSIGWQEVMELSKDEAVFIDVRTVEENELGEIDGSLNIPLDDLRNRLGEIPKDKKIIVYCGVGLRGYLGCRILTQNGFSDVNNLSGGYKTYELVTQKQENGDIFEGYSVALDDMVSNKPVFMEARINAKVVEVNACGMQCPGPIMQVKKSFEQLEGGDTLTIKASDPGFYTDIQSWARVTGNTLVSLEQDKGVITAKLRKEEAESKTSTISKSGDSDSITLIVFDDDLDRAIASFIIANGALAMGKKVNIFATFWGLNVLKSAKKPKKLKKNLIEKMFGWMLPRGSKKLKLSQMNMGGMGAKMIRGLMKHKNVDSLESMIQSAIDGGANIIACQMSMDLMGVKKEELIDGITVGGVATYLEHATQSSPNLFI